MRYFFEIAYHGKEFHGWQKQQNAITVQQLVEEAFEKLSGENIDITGSGRTDTGVHCRQQFFHADIPEWLADSNLLYKLNGILPPTIHLRDMVAVDDDAHARFDAETRYYEYVISRERDPFLLETSYFFPRPLDLRTLNQATSLLSGEQNFQSFSKVKTEVHTFICRIFEARWREEGHLLIFGIRANRFLRGMVRSLTGTLLEIGSGKRTVGDLSEILAARDRREAGPALPAHGLFLTEVTYPENYFKKG